MSGVLGEFWCWGSLKRLGEGGSESVMEWCLVVQSWRFLFRGSVIYQAVRVFQDVQAEPDAIPRGLRYEYKTLDPSQEP